MSTIRSNLARGAAGLLVLLPACGGGGAPLDTAAAPASTGLPAPDAPDASTPETTGVEPGSNAATSVDSSTTTPSAPGVTSRGSTPTAGTQPRPTTGSGPVTTGGPPPTTGGPQPTPAPAPTTTSTTAAASPRIERPSGTPRGTVFPPNDSAYRLLATGNCDKLLARTETAWLDVTRPVDEPTLLLYRAGAEACLQRWDAARRDFDKIGDPHFDVSDPKECLVSEQSAECAACKRAVFLWLTALLEARRRNPSFQPVYVAGTGASPCPADDKSADTGPAGP